MTILFLVPRLPAPPNDGGAMYVYQSAKALADSGARIVFAGFESNLHPQDSALLAPFCKVYSIPADFTHYGFTAAFRSITTRQPISVQHRMDVARMRTVLERVLERPDIIFLEGIQTAQFIPLCRVFFPSAPVILRQVNVEHRLLERNAETSGNPFIRWFYRQQAGFMKRFERDAMAAADAVTSISSLDIEAFRVLCPNQTFIEATPGIPIPERLPVQRDPNRLLAMAGWAWKPNIDGLVWFLNEVWPALQVEIPTLRFEIAGRGIPQSVVQRYESERVRFLGFVENGEALRQSSLALAAPLFSGSGIKMKVIEAFGSGLPVITTPIGIEGLPVEDGRHVVVVRDAADAIARIRTLHQDLALQDSIRNEALAFAETWSWDRKAGELMGALATFQQANGAPKRLSRPGGG